VLVCAIAHLVVTISYGHFGTTYQSNIQGDRSLGIQSLRPLKFGSIGSTETSVRNCHSSLLNSPEGRRSHLRGSGSLESRKNSAILRRSVLFCENHTDIYILFG
jgi:hypothetical protein